MRQPKLHLELLIPSVVLIGCTLLFRLTNIDIAIQRHFFVPGEGWIYKNHIFCRAVYRYGPLPAITLFLACLGCLIGSFRFCKLASYRKSFLFVVLLMVIGPGLVVNAGFKQHWGRPRPRSIQEFGGKLPFLALWQKGQAGQGTSFPSGHASAGFFWLAPYFLLRRKRRRLALIFLGIGLGFGSLIGFGRMMQGGHFASDVLWAGGMVYLCGLGLDNVLFTRRTPELQE